jgi:ATP-dependent Clp protease adapter protein ClpS
VAHVITLTLEEAKYRVGNAHGAARQAGFPLTFSIEPVAD